MINWEKIKNDSATRAKFNARLEELNEEARANNNLTYSIFFENVLCARADTVMHIIEKERVGLKTKKRF